MNGSYNIRKIAASSDREIKRLKGQVELFWEKELRLYRESGLADGLQLAEFGSGPGFVTEKILSEFPDCQITAVEADPALVSFAESHLRSRGHSHFKIVNRTVEETGLAQDYYDFGLLRFLLEHLPDARAGLREVYRVLKPGGRIAVIDNDFGLHTVTYPDIPELDELYSAYCKSREMEGGHPKIGRELPLLLHAAGFENLRYEVIALHSRIAGDQIFRESEGIGIPARLVSDGLLSSASLATITRKWRDALASPSHAIVRQVCFASGQKPFAKGE